jgi:hypothetical protein
MPALDPQQYLSALWCKAFFPVTEQKKLTLRCYRQIGNDVNTVISREKTLSEVKYITEDLLFIRYR